MLPGKGRLLQVKIDTLGPLLDTKPIYEALAEFKDQSDLYDATTKNFLRAKLKATIRELRSTATYLEEQLAALKGAS